MIVNAPTNVVIPSAATIGPPGVLLRLLLNTAKRIAKTQLAAEDFVQPRAFFGVHWTAYMIFMVLVGGLGRVEGGILGAVLFFVIETWFGSQGAWYLIGLGAAAILFALFLPQGLWGWISMRLPGEPIPTGYLVFRKPSQEH